MTEKAVSKQKKIGSTKNASYVYLGPTLIEHGLVQYRGYDQVPELKETGVEEKYPGIGVLFVESSKYVEGIKQLNDPGSELSIRYSQVVKRRKA